MHLGQLERLLDARFAGFVADHRPPPETHPRQLAEVPAAPLDPDSWSALAERGALALLSPRDEGGLGLGHTAVAIVAELMGAAGFPAARYLDTLLGLELMRRCPPSATMSALRKAVMLGQRGVAVAHRDGDANRTPDRLPLWPEPWPRLRPEPAAHVDPVEVSTRRSFVVSADEADTLLLPGLLSDGSLRLVLLPAGSPSLLLEARSTLGQRRLFDIHVHQARIPSSDIFDIGLGEHRDAPWAEVVSRARIWQAAYLTGLASGAHGTAVEYSKNRRQFGQPLARFQSIAFRLAKSSAEVHAARLLVRDVAARADAGEEIRSSAAQALALAAEVSRAVTAEAVHIHGAFGMTLQSAAQRYFRNAAMESLWLGTVPELHRVTQPS